jgi:diguanylate cyclase (GGDEF)-like protein
MRLIDRGDTPLAFGLIAASLILFQQPLRFVLDAAREVETGYRLDLVPALVTLTTLWVFNQHKKRAHLQARMMSAQGEARQHRERMQELEALVSFGRMLASALDVQGLRHAVSCSLPGFVGDRSMWVMVNQRGAWDLLAADSGAMQESSPEALEHLAAMAIALSTADEAGNREGVVVESFVCFPLVVGSAALGVLGVQERGAPLDPSARRALGVISSLLGIAVRNVHLLAETKELNIHDPLTGCLTRRPFVESLDVELRRSRRTGSPLSLLMIDVDEFKAINDVYGHLCGDEVLAAVGRCFGRLLRASDFKCRYGGDEFVLILPDTPLTGAEHVAECVAKAIRTEPIRYKESELSITVSIGIACAERTDKANELLERADQALYRSKHAGRDCWHCAPAAGEWRELSMTAAIDAGDARVDAAAARRA